MFLVFIVYEFNRIYIEKDGQIITLFFIISSNFSEALN